MPCFTSLRIYWVVVHYLHLSGNENIIEQLSPLVRVDVLIIPVEIGTNGRRSSQVFKFVYGDTFVGVGRTVEKLNIDHLAI